MIGELSAQGEDNIPLHSTSPSPSSGLVEVDFSDTNSISAENPYALPDGGLLPQFVSKKLVYSGNLNGRVVQIHLDPSSQLFASVSKDFVRKHKWRTFSCDPVYVRSFAADDRSVCCD